MNPLNRLIMIPLKMVLETFGLHGALSVGESQWLQMEKAVVSVNIADERG